MTTLNLESLKPLTTLQFDECKDRAVKRVERHLGEKPSRAQFQRELGRLWTVLDLLALVVFIPALLISSIHIVTHVGALSSAAFDGLNQAGSGTVLGKDLFVAAHQWLLIPLAEGSMILFLVMFGVSRDGWRRWVYFLLAALAVVFVLAANLSSGLGLLESVLAPAFTIGIGLKLEHLILQYLKRSTEVTKKYLEALATWEAATADATQHPDYLPYLMNELWAALMKPKGNQWAIEAPPGFKLAAVRRELSRENWTHGDVEPVAEFTAEAQPEEVKPAAASPKEVDLEPMQAGNDGGSLALNGMQPITSANGHHA